MRFKIEATHDEMGEKSESLVKALIESISPFNPDLAEQLEKALPKEAAKSEHAAILYLQKKTRSIYEKQMKLMLKDIGKVLDQSLAKASDHEGEYKSAGEEELEPGDINPDTGEEVEEKEEEVESEEPEETEE